MSEKNADTDFIIRREFAAPRDLVFKAWSDADALSEWWGAPGFGMRNVTLDFRPGGSFHYCMIAPNGMEIWGKFVYREISAPERIVFINGFSDAQGNAARNPWMAGWPIEVLNTVTLTENAGKTTLQLVGGPINATPQEIALFVSSHPHMRGGFGGTFGKLDAYLAKQ